MPQHAHSQSDSGSDAAQQDTAADALARDYERLASANLMRRLNGRNARGDRHEQNSVSDSGNP